MRNGIPLPRGIARMRSRRAPSRASCCCRRLTVEKGVRVVLQAVASLPRDARLRAGDRRPRSARERGARPPRPIRASVSSATSPARRSRRCSTDSPIICWLPSLWYENAPVAVIEAAAYGLGVIASRIGGVPELVREGRTGLLFEPGDVAGSRPHHAGTAERSIASSAICTPGARPWSSAHSV